MKKRDMHSMLPYAGLAVLAVLLLSLLLLQRSHSALLAETEKVAALEQSNLALKAKADELTESVMEATGRWGSDREYFYEQMGALTLLLELRHLYDCGQRDAARAFLLEYEAFLSPLETVQYGDVVDAPLVLETIRDDLS